MQNQKQCFLVVFLLAMLALQPVSLLAQSTKSKVFGSFHDIASLGGGCATCHVPHQQSANGEVLLWTRNFTTVTTFGTYSSPTMNSTPVEVGGAYSATNRPSGAKIYTVLCLSCHDGLTSTSVITASNDHAIANPTTSDGLRNDHPVNMAYVLDGGLESIATVDASAIKLFADGTNKTVQCASCHNVHDNTLGFFLRVANTNTKAGLCTTCHL